MWAKPPHKPVLQANEIHIYRAKFEPPVQNIESLQENLADDERQRAGRLISIENQINFVAIRSTLRNILAEYLQMEAASISFDYNDAGKPSLSHTSGGDKISFNLSHSGRHALFAFGKDRKIGIDLEEMRRDTSYLEIADSYFSDEEAKALNSLQGQELTIAFFRCWTRKEAYLKARGLGLPFGLKNFTVSLLNHEPPALLNVRDDADQAKIWSFTEIIPWKDYIAAFVCEAKNDLVIKYFDY